MANPRDPNHPAPYPASDPARDRIYPSQNGRRDADALEREIETTRSRIEARIDGLSETFSPQALMDRALGSDDTAQGDTFSLMVERARTNPLSAALIAAGLAGMVLNRPDPAAVAAARARQALPPEPYSDDAAERVGHNLDVLGTQAANLRDSGSEVVDQVSGAVTGAVSAVRDRVSGAYDSARVRLSGARERVSRGTDEFTDQAGNRYRRTLTAAEVQAADLRERARQTPAQARAGAEFVGEWVRENPVTAGLFALAAGATAASLLAARQASHPRTRGNAAHDLYSEAEREAMRREAARVALESTPVKNRGDSQSSGPEPKPMKKTVRTPRTATTGKVALASADGTVVRKAKTVKKKSSRSTAAKATTPKSASQIASAMPKTSTLGSNLDRSVAVQGEAPKKS